MATWPADLASRLCSCRSKSLPAHVNRCNRKLSSLALPCLITTFNLWVDLSWVAKYQNHIQNSAPRLFPKLNFTDWPLGCSNYSTILSRLEDPSFGGSLCVSGLWLLCLRMTLAATNFSHWALRRRCPPILSQACRGNWHPKNVVVWTWGAPNPMAKSITV